MRIALPIVLLALFVTLTPRPAAADSTETPVEFTLGWTRINTDWALRPGVSNHDMQTTTDPFDQEEGGGDLHFEVMSPSLMGTIPKYLLNPRLHAGLSVNWAGETSRLYGGLTWEFGLTERLAFEIGFGLGVHDGELDQPRDPVTFAEIDDGRPALGSRVLFREEFAFSYRVTEITRVVLFYEHYSNGGIFDDRNEGLDAAGVKIGFRL